MNLTTQFYTMISLIGMGILIGINFDTYNRFIHRPKRWNSIVFGLDILFWIVQAFLSFLVLMKVNSGELRFYLYLALLLGYAMYQVLIKYMYLKLLEWIISTVIKTYKYIVRICHMLIVKPVVLLITLLSAIVMYVIKLCIKVLQFLLNAVLRVIVVFGKILWMFVPKKMKKYFQKYEGIFKKMKNNLNIIGKIKAYLLKLKK